MVWGRVLGAQRMSAHIRRDRIYEQLGLVEGVEFSRSIMFLGREEDVMDSHPLSSFPSVSGRRSGQTRAFVRYRSVIQTR